MKKHMLLLLAFLGSATLIGGCGDGDVGDINENPTKIEAPDVGTEMPEEG